MGGDWFAERRGSGTTWWNNPGQLGVTSDPACIGKRENSSKSAKHATKWLLQKKQDEGGQSLPTGTGNRPRRGGDQIIPDDCSKTNAYGGIYCLTKLNKRIIINNNSALPVSGCNAGSQAAGCSLQLVALSEYVKKIGFVTWNWKISWVCILLKESNTKSLTDCHPWDKG